MSGLKRILQESGVNLTLGEDNALLDRLDSYRRRLFVTFLFLFFALMALVGLGSYGLWHYMVCGSTQDVTAWASAIGLSGGSASLVEILRRVWSEWARTSLVIALVAGASQATINTILPLIIQKL
jgi:hypothetical protein